MGLEIGQSGKAEAEDCPSDRHTGGQYNLRDPAVGGVVSRFPVFTRLTRFLIPPSEEYPVVGSSRDADGYQEVDDECSKAN